MILIFPKNDYDEKWNHLVEDCNNKLRYWNDNDEILKDIDFNKMIIIIVEMISLKLQLQIAYSKDKVQFVNNADFNKNYYYENWNQRMENSNSTFAYSNDSDSYWKIFISLAIIIMRTEISSLKIPISNSRIRTIVIWFWKKSF
jgi:hypothetical protein